MTRLLLELQRLYPGADDAAGTRALVLELGAPADWDRLSRVWAGVQADLGLPAPAIAVSGTDALQLWFSLQEPVDLAQAQAFLGTLQARYLADVAPARVRRLPAPRGDAPSAPLHQLPPLPPVQVADGQWSAFVAADLAPLFVDTPWLDLPPGDDGQASLLGGLTSIEPSAWREAWRQLQPATPTPGLATGTTGTAGTAATAIDGDPARFLRAVMTDPAAPLALRVEAAKALLPYSTSAPHRPAD
jgi:hypothetical protein